MDDVDAVQAQIARNMLQSGDWVSARLDGVPYLEKAPLWYWLIAICFRLFGVHDWVARIPVFASAIALCWLTYRIGKWAHSCSAGFYSGITLATCAGLFLFTRILIPDVCLTLFMALALWGVLRAIDEQEPHGRLWALTAAASVGIGVLLKGLIAIVFPVGVAGLYLLVSGKWRERETWRSLHLPAGLLIALAIAAPWHIIATLRNPPYFVFTMHSGPGEYKGFFWFYFFNEHLLRFLNLRYPRDYNTVPRALFWLLHFVWLFPWSAFLFSAFRSSAPANRRAAAVRLLSIVWIALVLGFFTFSTTQEYYSMPCYPAFALLIGMALARRGTEHRWELRVLGTVTGICCIAAAALLLASAGLPHEGDISRALTQHPDAYTLSMGHMGDLTLASFAYLRTPLALASLAFLIGVLAAIKLRGKLAYIGIAVMMAVFLQAARLAMVAFDPYLSSRPLAEALLASPDGIAILDDQYYTFSSVVFYTNRRVLLLNGRVNNLEYGSNAPNAPHVFITDADLRRLWASGNRFYLLAEGPSIDRLASVVGRQHLIVRAASGGKFLFTNLQWR